ncbi:helix-turn-helix domain-containing protein [Intestinimonas butyriciproducens]|uniref:helix-turn-helix domain-containing protein n=1 Tax=Intestinimonas butyriciproducens TaxID=1297617 RepID=UPI0034A163D7
MLDLNHIEQYRENNRLEAKLATGGLPHSIWETHSAFANSYGGLILLGVEERPDHSLRVQGLLEPHEMAKEFWRMVSDPQVVSVNILRPEDVWVAGTDDGAVLVIQVPPGERDQLPVYLGQDPFHGSYRRSGDGDYHCTRAEVQAMLGARTH